MSIDPLKPTAPSADQLPSAPPSPLTPGELHTTEPEPTAQLTDVQPAGLEPSPVHSPAVAAPPSYLLLAGMAGTVLVLDYASKVWAVKTLSDLPGPAGSMVIVEDMLNFALAYNKGGAFSMGASVDDRWRSPFFLVVGFVAVGFIISLYRKVQPEQWALRFGLPLVLGGALGNLVDRVMRGKVVDFIDYRAGWVELMNSLIAKVQPTWHVTDHWPTFNIADICICVGVGLIALDMFLTGRAPTETAPLKADSAAPHG